jgi:hypothetical protein
MALQQLPLQLLPYMILDTPLDKKTITSSPFFIKNSIVLVSLVTMPSTLGKKVSVNNAIFTFLS